MLFPELILRSQIAACAAVRQEGMLVPLPKGAAEPDCQATPVFSGASGISGVRLHARRRITLGRMVAGIFRCIVGAHLALALVVAEFCLIYSHVDPPVNSLMVYRAVSFNWTIRPPRPVPLAKVPRRVRNMLVWIEDGGFYENHGIELAAMKRAYEINKRLKYPLYGGSTLTMQLARTLFLTPAKSYVRKYVEVLIALEMDALLPKDRIIELYFNNVEWGKGIFGIQAASYRYYKRPVASLSADEQVRLITILSSPVKYSPYNFGRSKILRLRYAYLAERFD